MKRHNPIAVQAFLIASLGFWCVQVEASSHRDAPFISGQPQVDGTDFYMFNAYESGRFGFVVLLADYQPFQEPFGGPNYYVLNPNAVYRIHIDNTGDAAEDITFQFRFATTTRDLALTAGGEEVDVPGINVGPIDTNQSPNLNRIESYTLAVVRGPVDRPASVEYAHRVESGSTRFGKPVDNVGEKSIPGYPDYAAQFIYNISIPGCSSGIGRVFVGQRRDPFFAAIGRIFDLVNLDDPLGSRDAGLGDLADQNVTTLALEVPAACLTGAGPIIGGWTTAALRSDRHLNSGGPFVRPASETGDFAQVSRLGMPLVNEIMIGLADKDRYNASHPSQDAQFLRYMTNPSLPELLEILFGAAGVRAPNRFPRADLVATFLTGIAGLNQFGPPAEMLRLNTAVPATSLESQNDLGFLGGDLSGFPNGRRPGDDVVDIELRVAMGALCHAVPGVYCDPFDAPSGNLPFTDGTRGNRGNLTPAFPYLAAPVSESTTESKPAGCVYADKSYSEGALLPITYKDSAGKETTIVLQCKMSGEQQNPKFHWEKYTPSSRR
jgi:uncharacterized protein DUF4331